MLTQLDTTIWSPRERAAWAPPADLTVSQWAAAHREFPVGSSFPGRWDEGKGRLAVGPMDAFNDPQVERITLMGSARSVKTEIMLNMLGYAISQDPAPALWVASTESSVKRACRRILRMIRCSPDLARHCTGNSDDEQKKSIVLQHMEIIFATAGSAADLGDFEARYIFEDETDKYPLDVAGQGSPTQMAEIRGQSFWNRKIITASTPTDPEGFITKDYDRSDRRRFWVPCPDCGGYQVLQFGRVIHAGEPRGQWPRDRRHPGYIKRQRVARYQCEYCAAEITERQRPEMLAAGVWRPAAGGESGEAGPGPAVHQGYHWNALYSPLATWSEMAAKFFEIYRDREQLKTWTNLWDGQPWKEIVQSHEAAAILNCRTNRPAWVVPEETLALTAGIDSQKRGFWVVLRAWVLTADGLRESHKIRHGFVASFGELEQWLFEDVYRTMSGLEHRVWTGLIDTGGGLMGEGEATLTEQVYNWLRRSGRGRIFGSKGSSRPLTSGRLAVRGQIDCYPSGKPLPGGLVLWRLDTDALKDFIWARIENGLFHLDADTDEIYGAHLAAEVKERNRKGQLVWSVQYGRANHLLDCEVLAAGAAEAFNVWLLPRPQSSPAGTVIPESGGVNPFTGFRQGSWLGR